MSIGVIFKDIAAVAEKVAESIVPGADKAIEAGKAVLALINSAKVTFATQDPTVLDAAIDTLEAKVNSDVDQAIKDLEG